MTRRTPRRPTERPDYDSGLRWLTLDGVTVSAAIVPADPSLRAKGYTHVISIASQTPAPPPVVANNTVLTLDGLRYIVRGSRQPPNLKRFRELLCVLRTLVET